MILEQCKGVHCVDLGESFQTHIFLQNFVSIQPRTSPLKFAASRIRGWRPLWRRLDRRDPSRRRRRPGPACSRRAPRRGARTWAQISRPARKNFSAKKLCTCLPYPSLLKFKIEIFLCSPLRSLRLVDCTGFQNVKLPERDLNF